mgnify:FL=1
MTWVHKTECAYNFVLRMSVECDAEAWARKGNVEVHAEDADLPVVLRAKVDVLHMSNPKFPVLESSMC